MLPRSCLLRHQMMSRSQDNLRGEIPAQFAAQWQANTMDWKGNAATPAGTSRRHRLHSTTNSFRL
jgi:hypothetical protein